VLTDADRHCLFQAMAIAPRNQGYDETTYDDSYVKFFIYGDTQDRIPDHIKIYNKVGYAYGTLTEMAYIVDEKTGLSSCYWLIITKSLTMTPTNTTLWEFTF